MTVAKRDGRTGMAASLGGDTPAITARKLRRSIPLPMAKVELRIGVFDPKWALPSLVGSNPLVWMAEVDGLLVDLRTMPREIQEVAFAKGIIPYIPADAPGRS